MIEFLDNLDGMPVNTESYRYFNHYKEATAFLRDFLLEKAKLINEAWKRCDRYEKGHVPRGTR